MSVPLLEWTFYPDTENNMYLLFIFGWIFWYSAHFNKYFDLINYGMLEQLILNVGLIPAAPAPISLFVFDPSLN